MSGENPYGLRKLPFPLSYRTSLVQPLSEDIEQGDPTQITDGEKSFFVLCMTPEEQLKFSSALFAGADLIYPDEIDEVQSAWLKAREFPNGIASDSCMQICELIIDCINNDPDTQEALRAFIGAGTSPSGGEYGAGLESIIKPNVDDDNLIFGTNCSNDSLYGIAVGIVDFSFQIVVDVLEQFEFSTTFADLYLNIADNIPVWSALPPNLLGEFLVWLRDTALTAFQSFDTLAKRKEIACDLYCIMQENGCVLTYDLILDYFVTQSTTVAFDTSLRGVAEQLSLQTADTVIGNAMLAILYVLPSLGAKFGIIGDIGGISAQIQDVLNDTNPDWNTCDPCQFGCDFTGSNFQILSGNGTNNGNGTFTSEQLGTAQLLYIVAYPNVACEKLSWYVDNVVNWQELSGSENMSVLVRYQGESISRPLEIPATTVTETTYEYIFDNTKVLAEIQIIANPDTTTPYNYTNICIEAV